jgi:hypothetical protein
MLDHSCQVQRHTHVERGLDLYETPSVAVEALLRDFLLERKLPKGCECIVTNPPFMIVERFVAHALDLAPLVVMLLRLAFLESERRCGILEGRGLRAVHVFRKRLPMMHRDQWAGRKANSGMAFAWFIWDHNHTGPTVIDRISWER